MIRIPAELAHTLVTVLDEGTLDGAARRLHVTPSAISQRIKALEEILGRVLLVRTKPVQATEAAHPVVRYARQLALLEADAARALGHDAEPVRMPLAVNADSLPRGSCHRWPGSPSGIRSSSTCTATIRTSPRRSSSPGR